MANEKTVDIDRRQFTDNIIPFSYNFFIGDCQREIDENVVKLNEPDNSTRIFIKTYQALKWTLEKYPDIEYIIVSNENAKFKFDLLVTYAEYVYNEHYHYAGIVKNNCCNNDCYFLSRQAVNFILKYVSVDDAVKEENKIAHCLQRLGIHPDNIDISRAIYA